MQKIEKILPLVSLTLFLFGWQITATLKNYSSFILPTPFEVALRFLQVLKKGTLWHHTRITLQEIFLGIFFGCSLAFILGYLFYKTPFLKQAVTPLIVGFQAVPIVALAPLLIIWLGPKISSKVFVSATTLFFPVLINTIIGLENIDKRFVDLFTALQARWWQKFLFLELPASLPILFGGLKIGVSLAVIGAVVGEFVGADKGLGFLINLASGLYDTSLKFTAFLTLSIISTVLYQLIVVLEKILIKWKT